MMKKQSGTTMVIVRTPPALRRAVDRARRHGRGVGFVPTMGALHEGHGSLVRECRQRCGWTVVSIYVNPLQFETRTSWQRYPRMLRHDIDRLRQWGADLVYVPGNNVFPADVSIRLTESRVSNIIEGAVRPGHFDGVLTIVNKLFNHVRPDRAFFGEKDFQQLWLIRKLNEEMGFNIDIVGRPTVRDPQTGLALSSRNAMLTPDARQTAAAIYRALRQARQDARRVREVRALTSGAARQIRAAGLDVQYVSIVDSDFRTPRHLASGVPYRILAAARLEGIHLIDNLPIGR